MSGIVGIGGKRVWFFLRLVREILIFFVCFVRFKCRIVVGSVEVSLGSAGVIVEFLIGRYYVVFGFGRED